MNSLPRKGTQPLRTFKVPAAPCLILKKPPRYDGLQTLSTFLYLTSEEKRFAEQAPAYDVIRQRASTRVSKAIMKRTFILEIYKISDSIDEFERLISRLHLTKSLRPGAIDALRAVPFAQDDATTHVKISASTSMHQSLDQSIPSEVPVVSFLTRKRPVPDFHDGFELPANAFVVHTPLVVAESSGGCSSTTLQQNQSGSLPTSVRGCVEASVSLCSTPDNSTPSGSGLAVPTPVEPTFGTPLPSGVADTIVSPQPMDTGPWTVVTRKKRRGSSLPTDVAQGVSEPIRKVMAPRPRRRKARPKSRVNSSPLARGMPGLPEESPRVRGKIHPPTPRDGQPPPTGRRAKSDMRSHRPGTYASAVLAGRAPDLREVLNKVRSSRAFSPSLGENIRPGYRTTGNELDSKGYMLQQFAKMFTTLWLSC